MPRIDFTQPVPEHLKFSPATCMRAMSVNQIAFDIETGDYIDDIPTNISSALVKKWGLSIHATIQAIALAFSGEPDDGMVLLNPFTKEQIDFLKKLFSRDDCEFIAHNIQFDMRHLHVHLGIPLPKHVYCTRAGAISLGVAHLGGALPLEKGQGTSLEVQARLYEQVSDHAWSDWTRYHAMKKWRSNIMQVPASEMAWYVLEDTRLTYKLRDGQREWQRILRDEYGYSRVDAVMDLDQQYTRITTQWSMRGVHVDVVYIKVLLAEIHNRLFDVQAEFFMLGVGDIGTRRGQERYFFDVCGIPRPDPELESLAHLFTKTGAFSFGKKALKHYQETYPDETALFSYYQHLSVMARMLTSYLEHLRGDKDYPQISLGTITTRTSSSNPNIMNFKLEPPRKAGYKDFNTISFRGVLIGSPGRILAEFDYNAAEKRMQALSAQDMELALIFIEGRDLHAENAATYFKDEWDAIVALLANETDEQRIEKLKSELKHLRSIGKPVTFGWDYGLGKAGIMNATKKTEVEVDKMMANFAKRFWALVAWKSAVKNLAEANYEKMQKCPHPLFRKGYVENWFGRRLLIESPYFDEKTKKMRSKWYKASNYDPQSGVADAIKIATMRITNYLRDGGFKSEILMQEHDAIILDAVPEELPVIGPEIAYLMMTAIPYESSCVGDTYVAWPADCKHTDNAEKWGWRYNQVYPCPLYDESGNPIVLTYPQDAVENELRGNYLSGGQQIINMHRDHIEGKLTKGPDTAYCLYVNDAGGFEWITWDNFPKDIPTLHAQAQKVFGLLPRLRSIDQRDAVQAFVDFVDDIEKDYQDLYNEQGRLDKELENVGTGIRVS